MTLDTEAAQHVLTMLEKLVWTVHYGKGFEASKVAFEAQALLDDLKKAA